MADKPFNFDKFETEFQQKKLLRQFAELLGTARMPAVANQPIFDQAEGSPLHGLMQRLRVGQPERPADFDFELPEVITIAAAAEMCLNREEAGVRRPVQLPAMLVTAASRIYFNTAMGNPPVYEEISRPEASDLRSEVAVCHFLDGTKTVVDWGISLPNLKTLAQNRKYTERMTRACLHRLVSRYAPNQSYLISDLNANQTANYLLRTENNKDKSAYRRKELFNLA